MMHRKINVDLESYSWQARVGNFDGAFATDEIILSGDTRPQDFPGVPSYFALQFATRPYVPDIEMEEQIRELGVDEAQVIGTLHVVFSSWDPNPSLMAKLYADAVFIERFNKHAEYALLNNAGTLSVEIEIRAIEFPVPKLGMRYFGVFPIFDYSFEYWKKMEGIKERHKSMKRQALRIYDKEKNRDKSSDNGDQL